LKPYLEAVSSKVSPECQAIADATHTTDWPELYRTGCTRALYHPGMMTSQVQAQMLGFFTSMLSAKRILEVGTFTGFSTLCMAEAMHGKVTAVEHDPYLVDFAKKFFDKSAHGHKIELICGDALDVIKNMGVAVDDESRFDLIFIDGNKTQYARYFQLINDRDLLAPGGLICIDETLWKGCVYGTSNEEADKVVTEAMRELNNQIASDPKLVSVLLPIRNGLTLVRRLDDQVAGERDHFNSQLLRPSALNRGSSPPGSLRPRQRRGITQEGLAPQQAPHAGGKRVLPKGLFAAPQGALDPAVDPKKAPQTQSLMDMDLVMGPTKTVPALPVMTTQPKDAVAHEGEPAPVRQCSGESADSEMSLPTLEGLAHRLQTC